MLSKKSRRTIVVAVVAILVLFIGWLVVARKQAVQVDNTNDYECLIVTETPPNCSSH